MGYNIQTLGQENIVSITFPLIVIIFVPLTIEDIKLAVIAERNRIYIQNVYKILI